MRPRVSWARWRGAGALHGWELSGPSVSSHANDISRATASSVWGKKVNSSACPAAALLYPRPPGRQFPSSVFPVPSLVFLFLFLVNTGPDSLTDTGCLLPRLQTGPRGDGSQAGNPLDSGRLSVSAAVGAADPGPAEPSGVHDCGHSWETLEKGGRGRRGQLSALPS